MSLYDMICRAQSHDEEATLLLIKKFNPLLRKHSRLLDYEDAYDDLLADLLEKIYRLNTEAIHNRTDGGLIRYFSKTMQHIYYGRLGLMLNRIPEINISDLSEEAQYNLEAKLSTSDEYFSADLYGYAGSLTKNEQNVLRMIYMQNRSVAEIAALTGVSRQAVNQSRVRAKHKLEQAICHDPEDP